MYIGDLHIDDHHTAEDSALALGEAFDRALGPREVSNHVDSLLVLVEVVQKYMYECMYLCIYIHMYRYIHILI
jgi:imidazoleglycerol phosphate dehydratase HisB